MRHIKRFNESNIDALEELKDFCESNLAFLLDDKIQISYSYYPNYARVSREMTKQENIMDVDIYKVQIKNIESVFDEVYWDDIKDYFIPFLERLSINYKLYPWDKNGKHIYQPDDYVIFSYKLKLNHYLIDNDYTATKSKSFTIDQVVNDKIDIKSFYTITLIVQV